MVDHVLLGNLVDEMILVASIGRSQRVALRHAGEVLESSRLHVLSLVVNPTGATAAYHGDHDPMQLRARRARASRRS